MAYINGGVAYFDVFFTDTVTGTLVDPSGVVSFYTQLGSNTPSATITWTAAVTSSVGVVAKIATGHYQTQVAIVGSSGLLTGYWAGTGTGAAVFNESLTVGFGTNVGSLFNDMIENVYRRANSTGNRDRAVTGTPAVGASATSIAVTGAQMTSLQPGNILSVDMEVLYVTAYTPGTVTVIRGWNGSTATSHAAGATYYINPRYTRFDIGIALNDELRDLSTPDNGLFRVGTALITYNYVFRGYDLADVPSEYLEIKRISYRLPNPQRAFPRINRWREERNLTDAVFPSGNALILNDGKGGYPGQPMQVTYGAPFIPLVNLYDDATNTPASNDPSPPYNGYTTTNTPNYNGTIPNLSPSMIDIPPLGALIRLTLPREIARNFLESQPEPRKALEVPAGAIGASVLNISAQRINRIQGEAGRLYRKFPRRRY